MQDDHAGMRLQHREHMAMEVGIAEMVEDPVVTVCVRGKPARVANGMAGVPLPRIDAPLTDDDVDVVVL